MRPANATHGDSLRRGGKGRGCLSATCLKVLAHFDADVLSDAEGFLGGDAPNQQAADDRQVEGVEGRLECDDADVCLLCVLGQVNRPNGRRGDVQELTVRGLVGCLHVTCQCKHHVYVSVPYIEMAQAMAQCVSTTAASCAAPPEHDRL